MTMSMECRICRNSTKALGELAVLAKHTVHFFQCNSCKFIQTEEPHWLQEAYSDAIATQDVGIMFRNERNVLITASILKRLFPEARNAVDFGGGHGVFVRMMRDRGFHYHWMDLYAANTYSRGFEYDPSVKYDFLTAFEVLEHFVDPMAELERVMTLAPNVLFSTEVVPEPAPSLAKWWYFSPSTGQHVSFYSRESLAFLARHFRRHLLSRGSYHLFTEQPCSEFRFKLAAHPRVAGVMNRIERRPSLIPSDYERLSGRSLH